MAQIGQQAVGHVDAGTGRPRSSCTRGHARRRAVQPRDQCLAAVDGGGQQSVGILALAVQAGQSGRGVTQGAGDEHRIAQASRRCAAARCPPGTKPCTVTLTANGPRTVSPPTRATRCGAARAMNPSANLLDETAVGPRQAQRHQRPGRRRAHRGEVGQVDRQRLPADVGRARYRRGNARPRPGCPPLPPARVPADGATARHHRRCPARRPRARMRAALRG